MAISIFIYWNKVSELVDRFVQTPEFMENYELLCGYIRQIKNTESELVLEPEQIESTKSMEWYDQFLISWNKLELETKYKNVIAQIFNL